jgi:hypothetical protein
MAGSSSQKQDGARGVTYELRNARRRVTWHPAILLNRDGSILCLCMMKDVSASGAKLELMKPCDVPDEFTLRLSKYGNVHRDCKISWRADTVIGVRFVGSD